MFKKAGNAGFYTMKTIGVAANRTNLEAEIVGAEDVANHVIQDFAGTYGYTGEQIFSPYVNSKASAITQRNFGRTGIETPTVMDGGKYGKSTFGYGDDGNLASVAPTSSELNLYWSVGANPDDPTTAEDEWFKTTDFTGAVYQDYSGGIKDTMLNKIADFYDDEKNYLESRILVSGDVILLAFGGHGFEMIDDTEIIEVKQGPYAGDTDKT